MRITKALQRLHTNQVHCCAEFDVLLIWNIDVFVVALHAGLRIGRSAGSHVRLETIWSRNLINYSRKRAQTPEDRQYCNKSSMAVESLWLRLRPLKMLAKWSSVI